jgi:hypothetical protein
MKTNSHRSAAALCSLAILGAAALSGCATTGSVAGGVASRNATLPAAAEVTTATGFIVCSGGSASRFPEREQSGRTCRPSPSLLHAIY